MKYFKAIFIFVVFISVSCVKKVENIDNIDTNIFDEEYAGDQWFEVIDAYEFYNSEGQLKVKFEVEIPKENLPNLRPTKIDLAIKLNSGSYEYIECFQNVFGDFEFEKDYSKVSTGSYCLDIGLFDEEEDRILNNFTECVNI